MSTLVHQRVRDARANNNPTVICRVASGWVVLADGQFLRGYCLLLSDPVVANINALSAQQRATFLTNMVTVGDALLKVTDACRINYEILGNRDPALHAHIIPRYDDEPDNIRNGPVWQYSQAERANAPFSLDRDRLLMESIRRALEDKRATVNESYNRHLNNAH